jgi:hypothetical protein
MQRFPPMTHTITLQSRKAEFRLPYAYSHPPDYSVTIDWKDAGQVVRTETFVNVAEKMDDGEVLQRWERVN